MGSVYARLGTEVTVVEFLDAITPGMDAEVQKVFQRTLKKQGLKFIMGAAVQSVETLKTKAKVNYKLRKDDSNHQLDADVVLVATGRKPYTDGLGLEALGVEMTPRGQIKTDDQWRTNVAGIYAIGDVTHRINLTPVAIREGMAFVETVFHDNPTPVDHDLVASAVFTQPELGPVGLRAEQAAAATVPAPAATGVRASWRPMCAFAWS